MIGPARALLLVTFATLLAPATAFAWGDEGHNVIALIAEQLLTPAARRQVDALLAADTDQLTPPDLAARSTWADRWRDSDQNGSRIRYLATRQWHVADMAIDDPSLDAACFGFPPLPQGTAASDGPAQDCVVDKVEQFASELGNPAMGQAERILALKFLLHFVGDLHEPLRAADHNDRGGDDVMVLTDPRGVARPLSDYWNAIVVKMIGSDPQAIADALLKGAENETAEWSAGSPRSWAMETVAVARDVAYRLPATTVADAKGVQAYRLDVTDEIPAVEAARQQLARAGVRLAVLLNAALR